MTRICVMCPALAVWWASNGNGYCEQHRRWWKRNA